MTCNFVVTNKKHCRDIVHLNVGGTYYDTFYGTLATGESLFFHMMFRKSRHNLNMVLVNEKRIITDENNRVFIDRNGKAFKYILNYFRTGRTSMLPESFEELKQLYSETIFYQIHELAHDVSDAIRSYPKYEPYDFASYPAIKCSCKKE
uniref:BTB domain-containing protein n=1 Tax=Parastrongyloides trichosuri TaxID=131310 RepID=A0A0N4ZEG0_PARTI